MRILLLNVMVFCLFLSISCREKEAITVKEGGEAFRTEAAPPSEVPLDSIKAYPYFEPIAGFPKIKDTTAFIARMERQFWGYEHRDTKILAYKKIRLHGTDKELILLEFDWGFGYGADYPWKNQYLFTMEGNFVDKLDAYQHELITIFKGEAPLLLTTTSTYKGNGSHQLYKISGNSLENVYDGFSSYYPQTYDIHEDATINEPEAFRHVIKDYNKDGFNDLAFTGKIVLIEGTHNGVWFNSEIIDGKVHEYSIDNPFKKIPVELIFLYDPKTGHFTQKEDYSKIYTDMLFPDNN